LLPMDRGMGVRDGGESKMLPFNQDVPMQKRSLPNYRIALDGWADDSTKI
jgi:hypothetical protein